MLLLVGLLAVVSSIACQPTSSTPMSTATALPPPRPTFTPTPTPSSSPTPRVLGPDEFDVVCGPTLRVYEGDSQEHFLHWTEDGSYMLFGHDDDTVWTLDVENARLHKVAHASPSVYRVPYGFYADISPDGSRIVYSTCEHTFYDSYYKRNIRVYEIGTVNTDGTDRRRLTENDYFDNYPAWSPEGTEIAFVRNVVFSDYPAGGEGLNNVKLAIMVAGTGETRLLASRVALYPPIWSPDGQRLAFIAYEREFDDIRVLHVIDSSGAGLTRIGETTAPATWSPDGEELAFASMDGETPVIYAVSPDGTGIHTVWRGEPNNPPTSISQVSWSPDGSELLFLAGEAYLVRSDGTDLRRLARLPSTRAAWSPDGSRIAFYQPARLLVTMARDGTDLRFLVSVTEAGHPYALDLSLSERPVDLATCSAGLVVSEPEANPGLVHDCEVLLSVRDRLGGGIELDWSEGAPIGEWEGVTLGGEPSRVHGLTLQRRDRSGRIVRGRLTGTLPSELGGMAELRRLDLRGNYLNGSIPPELGGLTNLRYIDLSDNYLSGSIPPELENLTNLGRLYLSGNRFTGCIPTALRNIESGHLETLALPNCEDSELAHARP